MKNFKIKSLGSAAIFAMAFAAAPASAGEIVYSNWISLDGGGGAIGNYELTVTDNNGLFNYTLTVDPWNAESLGLFVDLGAVTIGAAYLPVTLSNVIPVGEVSVVAVDSTSLDCGPGCNINGTSLAELGVDDWELILALGSSGFEGIQTFSWSTSNFGLTLASFGTLALRAQVLCDQEGGGTLPGDENACEGSEKVYSSMPDEPFDPEGPPLPEPGVLFLMGAGLLGLGFARRRKAA